MKFYKHTGTLTFIHSSWKCVSRVGSIDLPELFQNNWVNIGHEVDKLFLHSLSFASHKYILQLGIYWLQLALYIQRHDIFRLGRKR